MLEGGRVRDVGKRNECFCFDFGFSHDKSATEFEKGPRCTLAKFYPNCMQG